MTGQQSMSSSSQPRAKSLRGNQKALSKSSLVSVASPPPPKLYHTQWLPIDDSMRGNQDLVKDGVSMPFFQDLKDLDQLRRASQELPEYDRLEDALLQMRQGQAAPSRPRHQHTRHRQSNITPVHCPKTSCSRDSRPSDMVTEPNGSTWICRTYLHSEQAATRCEHRGTGRNQLIEVKGSDMSASLSAYCRLVISDSSMTSSDEQSPEEDTSPRQNWLIDEEGRNVRATVSQPNEMGRVREDPARHTRVARKDVTWQRSRPSKSKAMLEAMRVLEPEATESLPQCEWSDYPSARDPPAPSCFQHCPSYTEAPGTTRHNVAESKPPEIQQNPRPLWQYQHVFTSNRSTQSELVDYPFASTRGNFADTAHLPLVPFEDPRLSDPQPKHLATDYDVDCGSLISKVFLTALPFGSMIETANLYPDEKCDICQEYAMGERGTKCDVHGAEAGTQYKSQARLY